MPIDKQGFQKGHGRLRNLKSYKNILYRTKLSNSLKGHAVSTKTRKKQSLAKKGKSNWRKGLTKETDIRVKKSSQTLLKKSKEGFKWGMFGKKHSEQTKGILSKKSSLQNNSQWNNGSSKFPYSINWTEKLRVTIREKYKNKCFITNTYHKKLHVHHINYNKQDCKKINLIPLLPKIHNKTSYNRDYWFAYFCYHLNINMEELLK